MDILDRLLGHDVWTTRQLLLRCRELSDEDLNRRFDIGDRSVLETFEHLVSCMERHTDFLLQRWDAAPALPDRSDGSIEGLLSRLTAIGKDFSDSATTIQRQGIADRLITNPHNGNRRSQGGLVAHLITHSMHHRAQILYMFEKLGLTDVIEGDALGWEHFARGWGWEDGGSYGRPVADPIGTP